MASILQRARYYIRSCRDGGHPVASNFSLYCSYVTGKAGLEIGGPSASFEPHGVIPLYDKAGSLDNCDFSSDTVWGNHGKEFVFSPTKPAGKSFFCEGSDLKPVANDSYDFVLSSHNLEHFANPVKALREWKRVLRPGGALILILPYYRDTFDHRRKPTPVANMLADFEHNVGEDDLSHLNEILEKHDLERDPPAGNFEAFRQRSLDNINNRCLHHHVFDKANIRGLLSSQAFEVLDVERVPRLHLCVLARL